MLRNPVLPTRPEVNRINSKIICLDQNKCFYSYYQGYEAQACLHQNINKNLDEVVAEATVICYYDDSPYLAVPHIFFMKILLEPPDGLTKSTLSLALILSVYVYPVLTRIQLLVHICARILS